MEITLIAKKRLLVIRVYGEIDHHTAGMIRKRLEAELRHTGAVNIAMDFGMVSFMDSAGIGMIIGRYKTVRALGGELIIYDASEQVIRLMEMAGIRDMVILSDTLQQGIAKINEKKGVCI